MNLVEGRGDYVRVIGVTRNSRQHIDQLIHQDEISALDSGKIESNFTAEPDHVFLGLETRRYRYASLYDPLLAMNPSKVDPLPPSDRGGVWVCAETPENPFLDRRRSRRRKDHHGWIDHQGIETPPSDKSHLGRCARASKGSVAQGDERAV